MENVGNLSHQRQFGRWLWILRAAKRETVDTERWREVNFVVFRRVYCIASRWKISVENTFGWGNQVQPWNCSGTRDDRRRPGCASQVEESRGAAREGKGCWRTGRIIQSINRGRWRDAGMIWMSSCMGSIKRACRTSSKSCLLIKSTPNCSEIAFILFGQYFASARSTPFRASPVLVQPYNRSVDRTSPTSIIPILWPVLLDRATRLANIFEVCPAEIFMLLDVQPEI